MGKAIHPVLWTLWLTDHLIQPPSICLFLCLSAVCLSVSLSLYIYDCTWCSLSLSLSLSLSIYIYEWLYLVLLLIACQLLLTAFIQHYSLSLSLSLYIYIWTIVSGAVTVIDCMSVVADCCYTALFSILEQTNCTHVACDSKWATSLFFIFFIVAVQKAWAQTDILLQA